MISRRSFLPAAAGLPWRIFSLARAPGAAGAEMPTFRAATSAALLGDVNANDARAAMRSWAAFVSATLGMHVDYEEFSFCGSTRLLELMRRGAVHAVGCTTVEFLPLAAYVEPNTLLVDTENGLQEYVLLVNGASAFRSVGDLRGHPLTVYHNQTTSLAMSWLETLLDSSNLGPSERFFSTIAQNAKLSRTVLPVFFRQSDACLVTRRGFETMCELNPQLGRVLHPIASSPPFLTSLFAFHRQCPPAMNAQFRAAVLNLMKTATGKELLLLFQTNTLSIRDVSVLRNVVTLVENAERIKTRSTGAKG